MSGRAHGSLNGARSHGRRPTAIAILVLACLLALLILPTSFGRDTSLRMSGPTGTYPATAARPFATAHPLAPPTYGVTFRAVGLSAAVTYHFYLDLTLYGAAGNATVNVTGLGAGLYNVTGVTASPGPAPGWQYFGSPSTGSPIVVPSVSEVNFTFAAENMSTSPAPIVFSQTQVSAGTEWDLEFNGTTHSSNSSTITVVDRSGIYPVTALNVTGAAGTVRYLGNFSSTARLFLANSTTRVNYTVQFLLQVFGGPGGSILPNGAVWVGVGARVEIYAVGTSNDVFKSWTGTGIGSYSGPSPQQYLLVGGPVVELAIFLARPANGETVRLTEQGLPNGTLWTAFVNNVGYSSGHTALVVPNMYPCANPPPGIDPNFTLFIPEVYENLSSPGLAERFLPIEAPATVCGGIRVAFNFTPQYLVLAQGSAGGSFSATDAEGSTLNDFVSPGDSVTFSATPQLGYTFAGWTGSGAGSYTGPDASFQLSVNSSIQEVASFAPIVTSTSVSYPLTLVVPASEMVAPSWEATIAGVTYSATGSELTTSPLHPGQYQINLTTALAADGHSRSVPVDPSMTIMMPASAQSVNVSFAVSYWVSLDPIGPGSVMPGSRWIAAGGSFPLVASPNSSAVLVGWTGSGLGAYNGTASAVTLNVSGPVTEWVTFAPGATPPDFWHRSVDLAAVAALGLIAGLLGMWLILRVWKPKSPGSRSGGAPTDAQQAATGPGATKVSGPPPPTRSAAWFASLAAMAVVVLVISLLLVALPASPEHYPVGAGAPTPRNISPYGPATEPGPTGSRPSLQSAYGNQPTPSVSTSIRFEESGLPNGTSWNVSAWKYQAGAATPDTVSGNTTNLTTDVSGFGRAVDFAIWTVPSATSGDVWSGTPNLAPPIDPAITSNVSVTFAQVSIASLTFRFHVVAVGLPAGMEWNASFEGQGYGFNQPTTDWSIRGSDTFSLSAGPIYTALGNTSPNGSLEFPTAYFPTGFDLEPLAGGTVWSNASAGPILRVATSPGWIALQYTAEYHVRVLASTGGTVLPHTGWFPGGTPVTLSATPGTGYVFVGWNGSGDGSANSTSVGVNIDPEGNVTEIATFEAVPYNITVTESGVPAGQTYSVVFNGGLYSASTSTFDLPPVTAGAYNVSVPDALDNGTPGERFVAYSLTATYPSSPGATFDISGPGVITVKFLTQYSLTIAAAGPGSTSPANGSYWEPAGSSLAILATPTSPSLALQSWQGSGPGSYTGTDPALLVTMDGVLTETAEFGLPLPSTGPSIIATESGLPEGTAWGAEVGSRGALSTADTLTIGPLVSGALALTVPMVLAGAGTRYAPQGTGTYSLTVTGNTTFTVLFHEQFLLTVDVEFGGSVEPYPTWSNAASLVTILAETPAAGYAFLGWSGNATTSGDQATVNLMAPTSLVAEFGPSGATASAGPKDAVIAAVVLGVPLIVGGLVVFVGYRLKSPRVPGRVG